jgi:hypothetical protein
VAAGGDDPTHTVQIVAGLRVYSAVSGLRTAEDARRVADVLNTAIDRLQHCQ